jgi:predicted neuraminidase
LQNNFKYSAMGILNRFLLVLIFTELTYSLSASGLFKGDKCIIKSEYIFNQSEVSFPSCHASTIIQTKNGMLAAWFGGTAERNPDVGIWISKYSDGNWSQPVEVATGIESKEIRYPCWNPVLFNSGQKILLFYKVGPSPSEWWGELITSSDNGLSWSRPARLPENIYGPIKNKPILLSNGELLCPSSTENKGWRVHMEMTSDIGVTWKRTPALNKRKYGIIQPTILLHNDGLIQMLCRSKSSTIMTSWSADSGRSWSTIMSSGLPNPNSGIDAVTLKGGTQLLVYNHLAEGRNMLNVAVSEDGKDWKAAVLLESGPEGSEFSYPAVIQTEDGMVHITYTWNRKMIKHVVLDPAKIVSVKFSNGDWPG